MDEWEKKPILHLVYLLRLQHPLQPVKEIDSGRH